MSQRNIRLVEFTDSETYPITKSAEGTNAYYCEFCSAAGYRPNYASCLRRIQDRKEGRLDTNEAACSTAIGNRGCMALGMQKEEAQAGHAIYYINRIKMRQNQVENAELLGVKLGKRISRGLTNPTPVVVRPQNNDIAKNVPQGIPHSPDFIAAPSYADAINKRTRELAKESAIENVPDVSTSTSETSRVSSQKSKSPVTLNLNTKGLSLLEIARLRKQATA